MVREFTTESGKTIRVGENAGENQRLCKEARQNDEWFHLDGGPSPHVILQNQGKPTTRDEIHDCAQLVKHFSKQKNATRVYVTHIACKWVSKNGVEDTLGKVTLKKQATRIPVVADESALARLLSTTNTRGSSSRR